MDIAKEIIDKVNGISIPDGVVGHIIRKSEKSQEQPVAKNEPDFFMRKIIAEVEKPKEKVIETPVEKPVEEVKEKRKYDLFSNKAIKVLEKLPEEKRRGFLVDIASKSKSALDKIFRRF
jgi:hypothetical protein